MLIDRLWPLGRGVLFSMDAERAHELTLATLESLPTLLGPVFGGLAGAPAPSLARTAFGVKLKGPIGLAAGLDKDGRAIPLWGRLGFGFVEIGTVTAHAQPGNDKPRLWRLVDEGAIVNRMGFNNHGSDALATRIRGLRDAGNWPDVPVGANLGKSKVTPNEEAVTDYVTSTDRLAGLVDWFTINVSSPNTPGLRDLQDADSLGRLIPAVVEHAKGTPVLLKLAPDLGDEALAAAVEIAIRSGAAGIIATNTTLRRDVLAVDPELQGGLSGRPLWPIAKAKIQVALDAAGGKVPVVGVGGVSTAAQARELLAMGCCAVQVYSGFIYEGPGLIARMNRELQKS